MVLFVVTFRANTKFLGDVDIVSVTRRAPYRLLLLLLLLLVVLLLLLLVLVLVLLRLRLRLRLRLQLRLPLLVTLSADPAVGGRGRIGRVLLPLHLALG
jgi:hypothetical protein